MRLFGLLVARNECHRYLQACLEWNLPFFQALLVYDDGSDDEILDVVGGSSGAHYTQRPDDVPTFMEHEGKCRQDALIALEELTQPRDSDWIFVIDADEFIVADGGWKALHSVVGQADRAGCKSVTLRVPEIWNLDPIQERTDGFWGNIQASRLFKWEKGGQLADVEMGGKPIPEYASAGKTYTKARNVHLLHAGYADEEDRKAKYERYSQRAANGHSGSHIQSIMQTPSLKRWRGEVPDIWRGCRELEH